VDSGDGLVMLDTGNGDADIAMMVEDMKKLRLSAVWPTQVETRLYKSSIEYYKAFAQAAKCDVGLAFHSQESDFAQLRIRKSGEPNPLVIGQEKFDTVFLQKYRDRYQKMLESGDLSPYKPL
jgi:hypothetical protein